MTPPDRQTGVILLAAGRASRFGSDKLAARLDGRAIIEWALLSAKPLDGARMAIVTGPGGPPCAIPTGWEIVVNQQPALGLSSSIIAGVRALSTCERLVIALGDMPFVSATHLQQLAQMEGVAFTCQADGRKGCPAAFPRAMFPALLTLTGDRGAAALDCPGATILEPPNPAMLVDIDTPEDLARETSRRA
ncbi:MAG: nucleotidyltransferase family protein [Erythrobacter sp.]|uniref:nucleotidyltransferase family protein n=1 Tax=Erythrobacter sp. TaxID=1042 RepID=UPI003C7709A6